MTPQIIGYLLLLAIVYAVLYKPVMRMLGEHSGRDTDGGEDGADPLSLGEATPGETPAEQPETGKTPWYRDRILPSTLVSVVIVDQLSKYLVRANLGLYESWPAEGIFRLTHGTNSGTAFGLFPNQTAVLIVASLLAIGFLYYFYRAQALPSRVLRLAIGLQLGGALGNLADRLRTGSVVDFIDVGWWPAFNLADSSIVIGIALLACVVIFNGDALQDPKGREDCVGAEE